MGSGASKKQRPSQTKHSSSTAVVAEIVVPGQSQPVKVKGHIASGFDRSSALGAAKLTEVAPSKYKVKIGNQDIGTFDAPNSDFQSYLQEAASLTVTNIETVGDDNDDINFTPESSPLHIPLQRQISGVVYSDDEDWENVATSLDGSDPKTPSPSLAKEDAKERRAKIKQAIKEKKEKLSQQEYQQMIANHKQEMELMEILREREKERHQLKLGSKVAERKKRRAARIAEKKEQEKLLAENMIALCRLLKFSVILFLCILHVEINYLVIYSPRGHWFESCIKPEQTLKRKKKTNLEHQTNLLLPKKIEKKVSKFHREVESRKENFSEAEYENLLKQHEEEVALLERRLNHQMGTQKRSFLDKLAARKRKKSEKALTAVELQELEAELQEMQKQFDIELKEKKGLSSDDDYKKLIAQHKMELGKMQEKLALQRQRQRQEMLDKLAARRNMRESGIEENLSADEVKELQLALNQRAISFKDELKDAKTKMSAGDCQRMIDRHRSEMEEMQSQLDEERDRMRQQLMTKLNQRKKTTKGQHGSSQEKCFSPEELKQLQLMMDIKNTSEKQKIAGQKNKISSEKYRELLDQHHEEMKSMEERLERERELSDQKLRQKLAARRAQRPTSAVNVEMKPENPAGEDNMSTTQDVQKLEREILMKEATFQAEVEKKRSKMSDADYQRLLAQHRKEIETLRNKLKLSQDRQKQHFQDKLAERRKRRGEVSEADDQSVHSITNLEEEIKVREATFQTAVEERRDQLSDEEYRRLLEQHQREMQDLREKLRLSQERQRQHFEDKLDERRRRRGMISHEQERKEVLFLLDNDGNRLEEDEIKQVEKEINDYDSLVESSIAGKKGRISQAEINKLMEEHARTWRTLTEDWHVKKQECLSTKREKGCEEA
ncbi:putative trichohyalin [Apostichopus japonicus]|uniref:Putative trichohyalin n=1 Tax=Stichopus japonicus TaxID=307972 RepID=A0A2G8LFY7_STIJA|nr:putative trichohyalin [Apostichopus japonicus]